MTAWHSAFIQTEDSAEVAAVLLESLTSSGYVAYDPFPGGNGTPPAFKQFVKHLVSPVHERWVRILGTPALSAFLKLSQQWPIVYCWLNDSHSGWHILAHGQETEEANAFEPFLKPNFALETFQRVQSGQIAALPDEPANPLLPADIKQLAQDHGVNPKQAERMTERMTSQLFGRLDRSTSGEAGSLRGQAQSMLHSGADWNNPTAQRLRAVAATLTLPGDWRTPLFEEVREAYSIARRLARNPKAPLLPAERDSLKLVSDAHRYIAVYVGKA